MPSQESRKYLQELRQHPAFGAVGNDFDLDALREIMGTREQLSTSDVKCIDVQIDGMPCEWVVAPGADPDLRLLYLHGGGYVSGSGGKYLPLAADLSAAAQCAVLLPDYRLAPEHRFPAAIEDCIRAHEWLIAHGPDGAATPGATFIGGDSAGGGLTLATLLALRDRGLQLPLAAMPLSACTDLTMTGESTHTEEDPICSARCMPVFAELYLGDADPRDPLVSPLFGDYTGIPPLLLQVGEHEMLRDDSVRLAARARAHGVEVTLEVWSGMVHVFQIRELPESREAIGRIADFIQSCLDKEKLA